MCMVSALMGFTRLIWFPSREIDGRLLPFDLLQHLFNFLLGEWPYKCFADPLILKA